MAYDANDFVVEFGHKHARQILDAEIDKIETEKLVARNKARGFKSLEQIVSEFPEEKPVLIEGLLRRREVMNLVSGPKAMKSFARENLAVGSLYNLTWLGFQLNFPRDSKILVIDNELDYQTMAFRVRAVCEALKVPADTKGRVNYWSLKGMRMESNTTYDIEVVCNHLKSKIDRGEFSLIIFDALYKLFPRGWKENDNVDITNMYKAFEEVAERLDTGVLVIHHATKGGQGDKDVTDIGAGGGALSRSPATHAAIIPHQLENHMVFKAVTRTFPPPGERSLKWIYPLWHHVEDTPVVPKTEPATATQAKKEEKLPKWEVARQHNPTVDMEYYTRMFLEEFVPKDSIGILKSEMELSAKGMGFTDSAVKAYVEKAIEMNLIIKEGTARSGGVRYVRSEDLLDFEEDGEEE